MKAKKFLKKLDIQEAKCGKAMKRLRDKLRSWYVQKYYPTLVTQLSHGPDCTQCLPLFTLLRNAAGLFYVQDTPEKGSKKKRVFNKAVRGMILTELFELPRQLQAATDAYTENCDSQWEAITARAQSRVDRILKMVAELTEAPESPGGGTSDTSGSPPTDEASD
jgi:hypothetical protein